MTRLSGMVFLAVVSSLIVFWIVGRTPFHIDPISFALGLVAAAVAEFFRSRIAWFWSALTQPYKPQVVKQETRETPDEVASGAFTAALIGALVLAGLVLMPILMLGLYRDYPLLLSVPVIVFVSAVLFLPIIAKSSFKPKTK
jgi:hypothetical protein